MNFSGELSFNQKIITEARPFEAPVLPRLKLKSVKNLRTGCRIIYPFKSH